MSDKEKIDIESMTPKEYYDFLRSAVKQINKIYGTKKEDDDE